MKFKIALVLMVIFTVNAFADEARRAPLAVEVRYSSIGTGADRNVYGKIDQLLIMPKIQGLVDYVRESGWGFEGESTQCIQFKNFDVARDYANRISDIVSHGRYVTSELKFSCDPNAVPQPNE